MNFVIALAVLDPAICVFAANRAEHCRRVDVRIISGHGEVLLPSAPQKPQGAVR
jgi:hypothetical protein